MGLLEALLGADNPAAQWANKNTNWLGSIGAGLGAPGSVADKLGAAAQYAPAGRAADASAQEKLTATNQTKAWLHAQGFDDLIPLVDQGKGAEALVSAYQMKAERAKAPEAKYQEVGGKLVKIAGDTVTEAYDPYASTGGVNPKDGFGYEKDLYAQYSSSDPIKNFETVKGAYERVRQSAALDTGAGDMGLIYGYMKMLDPGSVVRESEFAMAAQTGSYGEQIQGLVQRVLTGERLTQSQRDAFKQAAEKLYQEAAGNVEAINQQFTDRATRYGVDPSAFLRQPETYEPLGNIFSGTTTSGIPWSLSQ